jgi:exopolysaccharide biosynthesis polyprenyl glycosylphosphotransferase
VTESFSQTVAAPSATTPPSRAALSDDLLALLDDRSREILERRRQSWAKGRGWLIRRALLCADVVGLTLAFLAGELAMGRGAESVHRFGDAMEFVLFLLLIPMWIVGAKLCGLYDRDEERTDYSTTDDLVGVFVLVTVIAWLCLCSSLLFGYAQPHRLRLTVFWAVAIPSIAIGRSLARAVCRRRAAYVQNTVVVGAGTVGQLIAHKVLQHPEYGINVVGFVDDEPMERRNDLSYLTLLGSLDDLPRIIRDLDVERVIIAFSRYSDTDVLETVRSLEDVYVQVDIVPRLFDVIAAPTDVHTVEGLPLVGLPPPSLSRSSLLIKRALDVAVSTLGLLFLAPLFVVIGILIKLDSEGPVFFRQRRMGRNDEVFGIYKFRTMAADAEERKAELAHLNRHGEADPRMTKIPDDPRVTRVGKVLRRFSLDELPQLLNVLRGDMSLVGPRPLILDEDLHVTDWARRRLSTRPGMTGPWQVMGSSTIPFEEMVTMDYRYVIHWSLFLDLKLILLTVPAVLRPRVAD